MPCRWPRRTRTTRTCATAATSTGGCSPQTRPPQRCVRALARVLPFWRLEFFFYMHVEVFSLWMLESFFYGYVWFLLVLLVSFTCDLMSYLSLFCVSATSTGGCFQQTRPPQRCVLPPTPFDCQKVTQLNTHLFPSNCISMRLLQSFLYGYACFSFVLLVSFTCHLVCHIFACDFFSSSAL